MEKDDLRKRLDEVSDLLIQYETVSREVHHRLFEIVHEMGAEIRLLMGLVAEGERRDGRA